MCPCHLPPDYSYLRAPNFSLATVDVCYTLAQVEARRLRIVDPFDFDEGSVWIGVTLAALV